MEKRSYRNWMKCLKNKDIILRHDVDFDIQTVRDMMEIEREQGLHSVVYVDVHSPSYSMDDIVRLYSDFKDDGFLFGLHINTAYDYKPKKAWKHFLKDVEDLKGNIEVDSCVAHWTRKGVKAEWELRIRKPNVKGETSDE